MSDVAATVAETRVKSVVREYAGDGSLQGVEAMRDGEPGARNDPRRDATLVRDDYGCARGDGFSRGIAKIFVLRRKNEEVGIAVSGPLVIFEQRAGEADTVLDAQVRSQVAQVLEIATGFMGAGKNEGRRRRIAGLPARRKPRVACRDSS